MDAWNIKELLRCKPMPSAPPPRVCKYSHPDYGLGEFVYAGHYTLLHHILTTHKPTGMALEFGVGGGESTWLIAAHMPVIGFDSFKGLPQDWRDGFPAGMFAQDTIPHIPNSDLIVGLFEDTLPAFVSPDHVGLVHIDCDLYSSTKTVLDHAHLDPGTIVVFDEWHGFDGCEDHEQRAWREYADRTEVTWSVIGHGHEAWAIQIGAA